MEFSYFPYMVSLVLLDLKSKDNMDTYELQYIFWKNI